MNRRILIIALLIATQIPCAISLTWNIQEAKRSSEISQQSYKNGLIDGAAKERLWIAQEAAEAELLQLAREEKL